MKFFVVASYEDLRSAIDRPCSVHVGSEGRGFPVVILQLLVKKNMVVNMKSDLLMNMLYVR